MNPLKWSFRTAFAVAAVMCLALLGYAYYAQYRLYLEPCPLCMLQRVAFWSLAVVLVLAALHNPRRVGRRVYASLALFAAGTGIALAARHVWMQHLPKDQVPACGGRLEFMLQAFPVTEVLRQVLTGSGECAEVDWTFAGLSMPEWTLAWFVLFALGAAYYGFRRYAD
jgi:disulfide bond formation protein DsbB